MGGRRWVVGIGALVVIAGLIGPASGSTTQQVVRGHVTAPTGPVSAGPVWADACGLSDVTATWSAGMPDTFAFEFEVAPATRGRPFIVEADGLADLAVVFDEGDPRAFDTPGVGSETGVVPANARFASVCLTSGAEASFTYTAG